MKTRLLLLLLLPGCAFLKNAQLGAEEAFEPVTVERISSVDAGTVEVRCGSGSVCEEVKVVHVQRTKGGGAVEITLENRTQADVAVQLSLEFFDGELRRTDRTTFHDVILAPRGQEVLALTSDVDVDDTLIVHMRSRS